MRVHLNFGMCIRECVCLNSGTIIKICCENCLTFLNFLETDINFRIKKILNDKSKSEIPDHW